MNRLLFKLIGKKISIIGNGPVNQDYSNIIDSSDIVIRFNHFYRYDENLTGKRVDIVCQTFSKTWYKTENKHEDIIRKYNAEVFMIKRPHNYSTEVHKYYGNDIKVSDTTRYFAKYDKYTTGGAFLIWLSHNLTNAKVSIYGFDPSTWNHYIDTDANQYKHVANIERKQVDIAIAKLQKLTITNTNNIQYQTRIVIPIKQYSQDANNKNKYLLPHCIEVCKQTNIPITVLTDDCSILNQYDIDYYLVPEIEQLSDVTNTLRLWRDKTNYFGDIILVQCTSPYLQKQWILDCLEKLSVAPITATATRITYKPNAIFLESHNNTWKHAIPQLGPPSVPRQKLPRAMRITGAVEAFHSDNLDLESLWLGGRVELIEIPEEYSLDIDTEKQLQLFINQQITV